MVYLKSVLAGMFVALLAICLFALVAVAALVVTNQDPSGSLGIAREIVGVQAALPVLIVALVGFVAGFSWQFRQAPR